MILMGIVSYTFVSEFRPGKMPEKGLRSKISTESGMLTYATAEHSRFVVVLSRIP